MMQNVEQKVLYAICEQRRSSSACACVRSDLAFSVRLHILQYPLILQTGNEGADQPAHSRSWSGPELENCNGPFSCIAHHMFAFLFIRNKKYQYFSWSSGVNHNIKATQARPLIDGVLREGIPLDTVSTEKALSKLLYPFGHKFSPFIAGPFSEGEGYTGKQTGSHKNCFTGKLNGWKSLPSVSNRLNTVSATQSKST